MGQSWTNDLYQWTGYANGTQSYTANGLNQYTTADGATLTHDARGNLTGDGVWTYAFDADNKLKSATKTGYAATLAYDAEGRLRRTTLAGTITDLAYDGVDLVAEYDGAGTLLRRYVHGPGVDEPLVWYEGSTTTNKSWLYADHLGSIIGTANSAGTSTAIHSYGPFGEPNVTTGVRFRYTGQQYLGGLNLYYYKARFYSPALGRFLQTDPIGTADDLNLYAYVGNNPVNFSDPTGLIKAEADRLGAAVGGSTAAQMLVPGQTAWNNMLSNFGMGNYGAAAVNGVTYLGETALFALTLGGSQAYMASARAALPAVESVVAKEAPLLLKGPPVLQQTPGGRVLTEHAAERMATPPAGRAPMSAAQVDQVLDGATNIRKMSPHPLGDTLTIQNKNMPGAPQVVIDAATGNRVITVINPRLRK